MKRRKLKIFPEKKYKEIFSEIGENRYELYSKKELMPGEVYKNISGIDEYTSAIVGTGATITQSSIIDVYDKEIIIPKGSQLFVARLLRYDPTHGEPHYNANDQIIFPTKEGRILSFARNDAPDHFITIIDSSNLKTITEAYKLPQNKSGTVGEYVEKGASIHIEFIQLRGEEKGTVPKKRQAGLGVPPNSDCHL